MSAKTTPEQKAKFVETMKETYSVTHAAQAAGISRRTAYKLRDEDPEFAAAWDDAKVEAEEVLEASAYQRAMRGDTTLTIFLMKGMKPDRYRDYYKADINATGQFAIKFVPEEK